MKKVICWVCYKSHKVSDSQTLKITSVQKRYKTVKCKGPCLNCILNIHQIGNCKSKISCKIKGCGKRHNTILYNASYKLPYNNADSTTAKQNKQQQEHQQDHQVINCY